MSKPKLETLFGAPGLLGFSSFSVPQKGIPAQKITHGAKGSTKETVQKVKSMQKAKDAYKKQHGIPTGMPDALKLAIAAGLGIGVYAFLTRKKKGRK